MQNAVMRILWNLMVRVDFYGNSHFIFTASEIHETDKINVQQAYTVVRHNDGDGGVGVVMQCIALHKCATTWLQTYVHIVLNALAALRVLSSQEHRTKHFKVTNNSHDNSETANKMAKGVEKWILFMQYHSHIQMLQYQAWQLQNRYLPGNQKYFCIPINDFCCSLPLSHSKIRANWLYLLEIRLSFSSPLYRCAYVHSIQIISPSAAQDNCTVGVKSSALIP